MKRGAIESYSFVIGLFITIAIMAVLFLMWNTYYSVSAEQRAFKITNEFENISNFYKNCIDSPKDSCVCGTFSVSNIRQQDGSLFLTKSMGQSHLIATRFGAAPTIQGQINDKDIIIQNSFANEIVCRVEYDGEDVKETAVRSYDLTRDNYADQITVLKRGSKLCVTYFREKPDLFLRDFAYCNSILSSDKMMLLDSGADVASRQISDALSRGIVGSIGRVNSFFRGGFNSRSEWFNSVYSREKMEYLANNAFLVNVNTSYDSTLVKDRIIVRFLQGSSVGEAFANALVQRLSVLDGKYYYNSIAEAATGTVPEMYKFNVEVFAEEGNMSSPDGVYLLCIKEELPVCKEKTAIPAVFIEIADGPDGFSVYQGHEDILAESIRMGVSDFVKVPSAYSIKPKATDEKIFQ